MPVKVRCGCAFTRSRDPERRELLACYRHRANYDLLTAAVELHRIVGEVLSALPVGAGVLRAKLKASREELWLSVVRARVAASDTAAPPAARTV